MCRFDSEGQEDESIEFPFAVVLKPLLPLEENGEEDSFDVFIHKTLNVPSGTKLFDVFCCPAPSDALDASLLERIGTITSTSEFIRSSPNDGVFFRHQRKEEDYALRPSWPDTLNQKITIDDGKTSGTIGQIAGWKLFEQHIERRQFKNFEKRFLLICKVFRLFFSNVFSRTWALFDSGPGPTLVYGSTSKV